MKNNTLVKSAQILFLKCKAWFIVTILIKIMVGLIPFLNLLLTQQIVDAITIFLANKENGYSKLSTLLVCLLIVNILPSLTGSALRIVDTKYIQILNHYLLKEVSLKSSTVPISYFDNPEFHNLHARLQGNLGERFLLSIQGYLNILQNVISLVSIFIFLINIHWLLVVVICMAAIPAIIIQNIYGRKQYELTVKQTPRARLANYYAAILNDRDSIKEIRLFNLKDYFLNQWSKLFLFNNKETLKFVSEQEKASIFLQFLTSIIYIGSIILVIYLLKMKSLSVGIYVAVTQSITATQASITLLTLEISKIYKNRFYINDLFSYLEYSEGSEGENINKQTMFPDALTKGITFENVSFCYPHSNQTVLQNVSFHINPGEKIAIVGQNGSGKTTLVKCLMGLYKVKTGRILIDDIPIEHYEQESLYKGITVIFQDFVKYNLSVNENIAVGDIKKINQQDEINRVARLTGINKLIEKFPDGYNTVLGKVLIKGEDLSGGQWQNIALSRALLKQGEIFILDEPTSALDPKAEIEVFEGFERLTEKKTTIYISHRMASAKLADRILVMKNGCLVEFGSHKELLEKKSEYSIMYNMQARWYA